MTNDTEVISHVAVGESSPGEFIERGTTINMLTAISPTPNKSLRELYRRGGGGEGTNKEEHFAAIEQLHTHIRTQSCARM